MRTGTTLGILALAVILSGTAGCGAGSSTPSATGNPTASTTSVGPSPTSTTSAGTATGSAPAASPTAITIKDFAYQTPPSVSPGATVTVTNTDTAEHTVTADEGSAFDVEVTSSGTATFTAPSKPGTYPFHCTYHVNMHGTLTVK
jgi:plastocyanin